MRRVVAVVALVALAFTLGRYGDVVVDVATQAAGHLGISVEERMPYPSPNEYTLVIERRLYMDCPNGSTVYIDFYKRHGKEDQNFFNVASFFDAKDATVPFLVIYFAGPGEFIMLYLDQNKDGVVDYKSVEPDEKFGDGPCDVLPDNAPKRTI